MTNNDTVLITATPDQIARMDREQAERIVAFHRENPPTMDYMVEYGRSLRESDLAQQRLRELDADADADATDRQPRTGFVEDEREAVAVEESFKRGDRR